MISNKLMRLIGLTICLAVVIKGMNPNGTKKETSTKFTRYSSDSSGDEGKHVIAQTFIEPGADVTMTSNNSKQVVQNNGPGDVAGRYIGTAAKVTALRKNTEQVIENNGPGNAYGTFHGPNSRSNETVRGGKIVVQNNGPGGAFGEYCGPGSVVTKKITGVKMSIGGGAGKVKSRRRYSSSSDSDW